MASGIPPLLPASPPPMCKDDFNDDDDSANEDNDEFGDFSIATPVNHLKKPPDDEPLHNDPKPITGETNPSDTQKAPASSQESVPANNSLQEMPNENPASVQLPDQETIDSSKTSADNDTIVNTFVTVEIPSMSDSRLDSPLEAADPSPAVHEDATDDAQDDLTFCNEFTSAKNQFINSPSLTDSDSIEVPDDSFIICEETNTVPDLLAGCENADKNSLFGDGNADPIFGDVDDPVFGEFETSSYDKACNSQVESNAGAELFTEVPTKGGTGDSCAGLDDEDPNSDDFFQPFNVATALPSEKVTSLNFDDVFGTESNPISDSLPRNTEVGEVAGMTAVPFDCDFDDNDDFSDFVSPTAFTSSNEVEEIKCDPMQLQAIKFEEAPVLSNATSDFAFDEKRLFEDDVLMTQELSWTEIFCAPMEDHIEVNVNTIEGKLKCSSVWCKIKDIENSPALHYNWNDSDTNKLLLATLCVDSRNILFGPRWNSEVPRFASNLGFTPLVPQKAAEKSPQNEFPDLPSEICPEVMVPLPESNPTVSSVPDAHFDWNNSGLTNPLDSSKPERNVVPENFELQNSLSILNGSETKTLSSEASKILNNLPDLVVMEKQYIVFPIR